MIKSKNLRCGVKLVSEYIPYVQSVCMGVWIKAGAVDETKKISGISHLIEHMLFKGTVNRSARDIANDIDKIGGHSNAFTGKEATCYYLKTLSSNVREGADILLDMLLRSTFDRAEMAREKKVICEEIKMIKDTPDEDCLDTMSVQVFKGTPYEKSIIGTATSLKGISRDTVLKYINEEYTADRVVVSVAGNFDENEISEIFDEGFSALKKSKTDKEHEISGYVPSYRVKTKDIEQSHICLSVPGLKLEDKRYYSLSLLNNIIGGSMSSRLFQNIREAKGLAYSVFSNTMSYSGSGCFNIYAGVSHDNIKNVIDAVKEELEGLDDRGVTPEELSTAKEQVKSTFIFGQENINGRMFSIGKDMLLTGEIQTLEDIINKYDEVTAADIDEVKRVITDIGNYCGTAVTNRRVPLKRYILE